MLFIFFASCFFPLTALASTTNGTIDATNSYAWGENIGWINFGAGGDVHVTDTNVTGYAWSQNYGWINLQPSGSGVVNDGSGILSGYGWGEQLGYIDFSGVTIDTAGDFRGYAHTSVLGDISFHCGNTLSCDNASFFVRTDWRPLAIRSVSSGSGGGRGAGAQHMPPSTPHAPVPSVPTIGATPVIPPEGRTLAVVPSSEAAVTNILSINTSTHLTVGGAAHSVAVAHVSDDVVVLTFHSDPVTVAVKKGESVVIDVNGDGVHKLRVTYVGVVAEGVKVIFEEYVSEDEVEATTPSSLCHPSFVIPVAFGGANDADTVFRLQKFLNTHGFLLADVGVGSPGNETIFFGTRTRSAVEKFQEEFAIVEYAQTADHDARGNVAEKTMEKMNALLCADAAAVSAGTGSQAPGNTSVPTVLTRDLRIGDTGADVYVLQKFLNMHGTPVALSGSGSLGFETTFFGARTLVAVAQFQERYFDKILTPLSLGHGTGVVGARTRAVINELLAGSP